MKAIINNQKYNTNKADFLFEYKEKIEHKRFFGNFYPYHKIKIYKTKKGTYLKYTGSPVEPGWEDNKRSLKVLSSDEIKNVLIELNLIDVYEKEFGELEEG